MCGEPVNGCMLTAGIMIRRKAVLFEESASERGICESGRAENLLCWVQEMAAGISPLKSTAQQCEIAPLLQGLHKGAILCFAGSELIQRQLNKRDYSGGRGESSGYEHRRAGKDTRNGVGLHLTMFRKSHSAHV